MSRAVSVAEAGGWSAAIREAIRRKGEGPDHSAAVTIISPNETDKEIESDERNEG